MKVSHHWEIVLFRNNVKWLTNITNNDHWCFGWFRLSLRGPCLFSLYQLAMIQNSKKSNNDRIPTNKKRLQRVNPVDVWYMCSLACFHCVLAEISFANQLYSVYLSHNRLWAAVQIRRTATINEQNKIKLMDKMRFSVCIQTKSYLVS